LIDFFGLNLVNNSSFTIRIDAPARSGQQGGYPVLIGHKGPMGEWLVPGEWNFFAFTWKFSSQEAAVYQGTLAGIHLATSHTTDVTGPIHLKSNWFGGIGNCRSDLLGHRAMRPMCGYIDNVRIFSRALDANAIEAIYKADLKNEAPEFLNTKSGL
jgi:hypothetical protein